jgi:uncharacterized protein (DUF2141 family)
MNARAQAGAGSLDLSISGLRNAKGNVLICLTTNPKGFPDCKADTTARKIKVAAGQAAHIHVTDLPPGTYAISLIHDENGNNKMDTMMMMPREGFGFSRDPKIRFGPPKFAAAQFAVGAGANGLTVRVKYMM